MIEKQVLAGGKWNEKQKEKQGGEERKRKPFIHSYIHSGDFVTGLCEIAKVKWVNTVTQLRKCASMLLCEKEEKADLRCD